MENYLKEQGYTGNISVLECVSPHYDLFISKMENHSIFRYIVEKGIEHSVNRDLILNYLYKNEKITNKSRILECEISNNKHKKLRRFLTIFKTKKNKKDSNNSIYIRKLKLGYITMNKLHREFVDYVVSRELDKIYYNEIIKIIDFINSKYIIKNISNKELKIFIKETIIEADRIYNDKFCDKPQVIAMSNVSNLIHDSLSPYITLYNKNKSVLEMLPYLQYYKDCSDHGFYYPDNLRAMEWDYACSANWDIGNDFDSQMQRINKNTKLNTLVAIYKGLIDTDLYSCFYSCFKKPSNSINKKKLLELIKKYNSSKISHDTFVKEINAINISTKDFVGYCQTYYSENLVFTLIAIL